VGVKLGGSSAVGGLGRLCRVSFRGGERHEYIVITKAKRSQMRPRGGGGGFMEGWRSRRREGEVRWVRELVGRDGRGVERWSKSGREEKEAGGEGRGGDGPYA